MTARSPIHATAVALRCRGAWKAVLILGRSGAGKSDLALRLIDRGWRLISDDYTRVWASGGALHAAAPETIAGRIEARGVGIVTAPTWPVARVVLAVEAEQTPSERLPEPVTRRIDGVAVPLLTLDLGRGSTVAKVAAALQTL
ncbi:HPr kinase/phosphorylase [Brevundimonas sp. SORGH_AS_0993]|uniref:HPr kinase/phosphorylase n=1 Tax=Brevundimonas sp. SORGH_AS_0993 TaxID=3041794 RepID=UPI00278875A5|nr:HPr kinase/phosphatase C-terminal domain-containing protein [Brevundimonas sp. SORGH_AS_0993]MDQ1154854.1 serine kinase of HPr protein (carbohydrate metabolism regulator) [Brevundimonas sp. SORGH_AS_0993]